MNIFFNKYFEIPEQEEMIPKSRTEKISQNFWDATKIPKKILKSTY